MRFPAAVLSFALFAIASGAQEPPFRIDLGPKATRFADVAKASVSISPTTVKPGEVVTVKLTVKPEPFCWTYPAFVPDQASKSVIEIPPAGDLIFLDKVTDPPGLKPKKGVKPGDVMQVYFEPATWEFEAIVSPKATPGKKKVELVGTRMQACNEDNCFYTSRTEPFTFEVDVLPGPAGPIPERFQKLVSDTLAPSPPAPAGPREMPIAAGKTDEAPGGIIKKAYVPIDKHKAALDTLLANLERQKPERQSGLWGLLATAAAWGLLSLITPCVFPMIPITVSLFLKQSHQSTAKVVQLAGVYCLTIIFVLGLSAITLLTTFREWSVSPWMNIALGVLFIVLALSLFGMFDLTLPSFMLRYAEGKRKGGGLIGAVFGAVAFSIVSFTCVAPFLGGFAGMASSKQYSDTELVLAGLAFSTAFASPFFLLALFPSLIKQLPKSGGWLETVKVVMGFLEVAAAIKFFRTAELRILDTPQYFTYDLSLAGMAVVLVACGLYLLGLFRLPHDEERSHISAPRMLWALLFIGLGVYLIPGTFKGQRPRGVVFAWVDAFLLPEPDAAGDELPWRTDLPAALDSARQSNGLVFADFTGVTCTNCKDNEYNVFPDKSVRDQLKKYTLVQMYTDEVPAAFYTSPPTGKQRNAEAAANLAFQKSAFGTEQLPLYVIFEPLPGGKARVVGVYDEGKINDRKRFTEFLKQPLER